MRTDKTLKDLKLYTDARLVIIGTVLRQKYLSASPFKNYLDVLNLIMNRREDDKLLSKEYGLDLSTISKRRVSIENNLLELPYYDYVALYDDLYQNLQDRKSEPMLLGCAAVLINFNLVSLPNVDTFFKSASSAEINPAFEKLIGAAYAEGEFQREKELDLWFKVHEQK